MMILKYDKTKQAMLFLLICISLMLLKIDKMGFAILLGIYCGAVYFSLPILVVSLLYAATNFLMLFKLNVVFALICALIFSLLSFISIKLNNKTPFLILAMVLVFLAYFLLLKADLVYALSLFLISLCCFLLSRFGGGFVEKVIIKNDLTYFDLAYIFLICLILGNVLGGSNIILYSSLIPISVFLRLTIDKKWQIFCLSAIFVGVVLNTLSLNVLPLYFVLVFIMSSFCASLKVSSCLSAASFAGVALFLIDSRQEFFIILGLLLAIAVVVVIIPKKVLSDTNRFETSFVVSNEHLAESCLKVSSKINEVGNLFEDLQNVILKMTDKSLSKNFIKEAVYYDCIKKVCQSCSEKQKCLNKASYAVFKENLGNLIYRAIEEGSANLIILPNFFVRNCPQIHALLSQINTSIKECVKYNDSSKSSQNMKGILANQYLGISKLLKKLSLGAVLELSLDEASEKDINKSLKDFKVNFRNLKVYMSSTNDRRIVVEVLVGDGVVEVVSKCIASVLNCNIMLAKKDDLTQSNMKRLEFVSQPKFEIQVGKTQVAKGNAAKSGDFISVLKVNQNKMVLSLADGMGSGNLAFELGSNAISLIENFYKAGFDDNTVLDVINNIMSFNSSECFVAMDICVIDLAENTCDFVKIGAVESFVSSDTFYTVESSSLPLGIIDEIKPSITRKIIKDGDVIMLVSDGVTDVLRNEIPYLMNALASKSPQVLTNEVVAACIKGSKVPLDDISAIAVKIVKKINK